MSLTPGYGRTPVSHDDLESLLPPVRELLGGGSVSRAALYDLEQATEMTVAEDLFIAAIDGSLPLEELCTDRSVRELHGRLYGDIWDWAGLLRRRELNIGVAPEQVSVELRASLESIHHRWRNTDDWTPHEMGIAVHADTVRIHPFSDGNGRTTRLLADLVFAAAQESAEPELYDWDLDKRRYVYLLREFDRHRDVTALAAFIKSVPLGQ